MKIKNVILVLTFSLATNVVFSQANVEKTGALLWKISGKDLPKPSYLLGTFHLKPGAFLDSIPGAKSALLSAEQVIGELSMADKAGLLLQTKQAMMMPADTTYQMLYSEEEYQFVNKQLTGTFGVGLDQLKMLVPAGINTAHVMMMFQKYFPDANPEDIIDAAVQNIATENNKPIVGLETIEEQIKIVFGVPLKRQAEVLLCSLKEPDYSIRTVESIIEAYNRFDLTELYKISLSEDAPCPASKEEMDQLNKNRNDKWMQVLPAMMKEKSSFVAVGALHLIGEEGLLNQLEKAGYTVEAVQE